MNILFLTLYSFESIYDHNIYPDLLREFIKHGHNMYIVSPIEKRDDIDTHLVEEGSSTILRLKIGDTQKTTLIKKGINTLLIEPKFKKAVKRYFPNIKFDLILYSTPPITFVGAIEYVKKRDKAFTYLLLKDIFPQNAVDLGMMKTNGLKGLLYKYFRNKEKRLYRVSDRIGCMSEANVQYLNKHNSFIDPDCVEVCPNSIEVIDKSVSLDTRNQIRIKYNIPLDKKVFIYGGNLGKPQGIPFLIDCLMNCNEKKDVYFLIVGDGTEYIYLENYQMKSKQQNVKIMKKLPKEDYDTLVASCDVGMLFLDYRFTIPNFPSRLLTYMQAKIPVIACTDPNSDVGAVIKENGFGWWCKSNDVQSFSNTIEIASSYESLNELGDKAFAYLCNNYSAENSFNIIIENLPERI